MDLLRLPIWKEMKPITLEEMSGIKLMNRIDTKYIIPESMLPELLEQICDLYRVQIVASKPVSGYETLYFDTSDIQMYTIHHNGKLRRKKIRCRTYIDSDLTFLEVKRKDNKGRTRKKRIPIPPMVFDKIHVSKEAHQFLEELTPEFPMQSLLPQVYNRFDRITLVNNAKTERLTIDANIRFKNYQTGIERDTPGFMIIELKQDGQSPSVVKDLLKDRKVQAKGFSKYCLGTMVTNPVAKSNRFKRKLRTIGRITKILDYDTLFNNTLGQG